MAKDVNFDNAGQTFNIELNPEGDLRFLANGKNGNGDRRMVIYDLSNEIRVDGTLDVEGELDVAEKAVIGGAGRFGALQLLSSTDEGTVFLGATEFEASILLGGVGDRDGRLKVFDSRGDAAIELRGDAAILNVGSATQDGDVSVMSGSGHTAIQMDGQLGQLTLKNEGDTTIKLDGTFGIVTVGASGEDGAVDVTDDAGDITIRLSGNTGSIECVSLTETAGRAAGLQSLDALACVRGIRTGRQQTSHDDGRQTSRIGLIGDDVQAVCPELVSTNGTGGTMVNYAGLTALLVEAVKQQQSRIDHLVGEVAALGGHPVDRSDQDQRSNDT